MKTSKEVLAINKFLEHLRNGLKEIGYNIGFVYNNDKEEVRISGMRAVDIVNVYANSTKAVGIDVAKRLHRFLQEEL